MQRVANLVETLLFLSFFSQTAKIREIIRKCSFSKKERPFLAAISMLAFLKSIEIGRRWGCRNRSSSTTHPGTTAGPPGETRGRGVNPYLDRQFGQNRYLTRAKSLPSSVDAGLPLSPGKCRSLQKQSLFFNEKTSLRRGLFFNSSINTFGFLFFSLLRLPEGSRPPTDPKLPFPYWKIDHFTNACLFIFCFNRRNLQNQQKSARDG